MGSENDLLLHPLLVSVHGKSALLYNTSSNIFFCRLCIHMFLAEYVGIAYMIVMCCACSVHVSM